MADDAFRAVSLLFNQVYIRILNPEVFRLTVGIHKDIHMSVRRPGILDGIDMAVYGESGPEINASHGNRTAS